MMLIKTLFKGNFLKKIHTGKFLDTNDNIPQLIQVYESSINLSFCEYDNEIEQYTQTPIYRQNFFFIIFDSGIINNQLVLLTSTGLMILKFDGNKWNIVIREIFNINCEERDKLMYLEINERLGIIVCYSNTQLFSIYKLNDNSLIKINKNIIYTSMYIRKIFIFEEKDIFIVSILTQNSNLYSYENLCFSNNNYEEIKLKENTTFELYDTFTKKLTNAIIKQTQNQLDVDIIFDINLHYIFVICETLILIFKIDSIFNFDEDKEQIEFKCRIEFKEKKPIFIDYYENNGIYFFFFDDKFLMYKEKNLNNQIILEKKKLIPKENKKKLFGKNFLQLNDGNSLFYDCKGSLIFVNFTDENDEKCSIKIINKLENEGMFLYDSTSNKNNKEKTKIYSLCGIKGESRLIRYVDGFIEDKIFETNINEDMSKIIFIENPVYGKVNKNIELRLFLTSSFYSSNLYIISPNFKMNKIKEFNIQGLGIYPSIKNSNEYYIILKNEIFSITFTNADYSNIEEEKIFIFNEGIQIISHSIFSLYNGIYMIIYLSSRILKIIELTSKKEIYEIKIPDNIEISVLNNINLNNSNVAILIGNYNGRLDILYYDINENKIDLDKKISNVFSFDDNNENSIVPETIKVVDKYIFISTRTGEFCSFIYNDNEENKNLITVVFDNISNNKIPLYISNIEIDDNNNFFYSVDFYNIENAYNFKINFTPKNEACHKSSYIIKKNNNIDNQLICFNKISKYVYLYQTKGKISFSTFNIYNSPSQYKKNIITQNNIVIDTVYNFNKDEKGVKIISFENDQILVITDKLFFYLFDTNNNTLILKNEIEIDKNTYLNLKVKSLREFKIEIPNEDKYMNIICVCLQYSLAKDYDKGMILIYELKNNQIIFIRKLLLPKILYDICFLKNYIVIGSDNSIGLISYELNSNNIFEIKNDGKLIQYMNKIISLQPLNNNASSNILIVGDSEESFQLLEFENQYRFNTNGADIANRILMNATPINNSYNDVFLCEKNGVVSIFKLNDEIYEIKNSIDLKECVNLCFNDYNHFILNSILGSLYNIKIYDTSIKENRDVTDEMITKLEEFQRKVFCEINKIYFNKDLDYEIGMLMNVPIKNAIMIDELFSICDIYKSELYGKISNFDEMVATLSLLSDELYLNIE